MGLLISTPKPEKRLLGLLKPQFTHVACRFLYYVSICLVGFRRLVRSKRGTIFGNGIPSDTSTSVSSPVNIERQPQTVGYATVNKGVAVSPSEPAERGLTTTPPERYQERLLANGLADERVVFSKSPHKNLDTETLDYHPNTTNMPLNVATIDHDFFRGHNTESNISFGNSECMEGNDAEYSVPRSDYEYASPEDRCEDDNVREVYYASPVDRCDEYITTEQGRDLYYDRNGCREKKRSAPYRYDYASTKQANSTKLAIVQNSAREGALTDTNYDSTVFQPERIFTGNLYDTFMQPGSTDDNYSVSTLKEKRTWRNDDYSVLRKTVSSNK